MAKLGEMRGRLERELPALLERHGVPAAAIAVVAGDEVAEVAAGVLNTGTGVSATTDSVFQIGSITKVWTATLVLQLVDEGRVELDAPVRRYLPDLRLGDEAAAAAITVRQLLSHTGGFEGDIFTDTGPGDDCVEKYVATLSDVAQLFDPGELFSYNNAGYVVLGRIVEVLREKPYDECLRDQLATPLGLTHFATGASDAIRFRAALGHIAPEPGADLVPAPMWSLMRSNGPAGSVLSMTARDLTTFARMHLAGGTWNGHEVLSAKSVAAMPQRQVTVPPLGIMGDGWGLGWELFDAAGGPVYGHDGNTIGQAAFLRLAPEQGVVVALLTNGGDAMSLYAEIVPALLRDLAGVEVELPPKPPAEPEPFEAARYLGTYSSTLADLVVSQDDGGRVWLEQRPKGVAAELAAALRSELVRLRDDTLILREAQEGIHLPLVFLGDDGDGHAQYVHSGRATRRAG
ncbi:serine hydrolase domain-containing protein [Amycolatopsis jiangsuensis]|uniref:CubicO group peptidase (Beta-lactamase class C family) n=1 Tax=Amycolatopsis jiangsuensis TaxID=1181879 RepID=A0A840IVI7_9PSEU|nr:serine hydrolase domain-containing protein [Amycolatopsis jiangsuensis]MBB4685773.1 CubicO group peptidase (beta-lactamase class C family) [Amycolatopsis jiangsuensis]